MRVMITGGGTGGHTSPAVALIEELQARDPQLAIQWVGCRGAIEERICRALAIPFRAVPAEGWPRRWGIRRVYTGVKLALGIVRAWVHVRRFQPDVVVGVGGYVTVPVGLVAQGMGVPTVLHEQNKRLGMANRLLAKRADRILLSYADTIGDYPRERATVVGNPVRAGFLDPPDRIEACRRFDLDRSRKVVLVCGGSQGAVTLNDAMVHIAGIAPPGGVQFIWMTGKTDAPRAMAAAASSAGTARVFSFIDDMPGACAAADLVVGRAGASSTAELAAMGKPCILVPFPHATDNHQEQNARAFESAGAAVVLLDAECSGERLDLLVRELLADGERLGRMQAAAKSLAAPGAADAMVETIFGLVFGARKGEGDAP